MLNHSADTMSDEKQSIASLLIELDLPEQHGMEMSSNGALWTHDLRFIETEDS